MMNWIATHQDAVLFALMAAIAILAYKIGTSTKNDEIHCLISDYEQLLTEAYADRQNLTTALASIQSRTDGEYLGYRAAMKRTNNN